jgi:membrane associated rhomboid family serine protease
MEAGVAEPPSFFPFAPTALLRVICRAKVPSGTRAMTVQDYPQPVRHELNYEPQPPVGDLRAAWVTNALILINVIVFIADWWLTRHGHGYRMLTPRGWYPPPQIDPYGLGPLELWGFFSPQTAVLHGQFWRFITFQFLHAGTAHLLMNMVSLYFFGPMIEQYLGRARFIAFYLVCGIGGAVSYLILWTTGILIGSPWLPLVGASAGIFGILIAAALVAPDATVMLLFPPIPMRLKILAWIMLGLAAWTVITHGRNAGGEAAHLGGALVGYALIFRPWRRILQRRRLRGPQRPQQWWA